VKKVRVFDLAKDFGMKGPEFVKKLRDLGFDQIKTHMTVLDDALEMMVLARLDASGMKRRPAGEEAATGHKGKKKLPGSSDVELESAPAGATTASPGTPAKKELKELPKKQLPKAPPPKKTLRRLDPVDEPAAPEIAADTTAAPHVEPEEREPAAHAPAGAVPPAAHSASQSTGHSTGHSAGHSTGHSIGHSVATPPAAEPRPREPEPAIEVAPESEPPPPPMAAPQSVSASASAAAPHAPTLATPAPASPSSPAPHRQHGPQAPAAGGKPAMGDDVKRLLVPQKKATVVGRIELPQETIRDATRRSAPASERDLRRMALQKTQQRTATRSPMPGGQRRGPPTGSMQRSGSRQDSRGGFGKKKVPTTVDPQKEIEITPPVSIKSLSEAIGTKVTDLIQTLAFKLNIPGKNINSYLSQDEVELVAIELGRNVKIVEQTHVEEQMLAQLVEDSAGEQEILRAPVVTFMGHVDHGKTSLMDALRASDVAKGEAGGITQHIGAYKVTHPKGTFVILDTPGHAAFTAMRARGAELTDLVVLVVAGDDGVMPQTEEAINHAKAAKVPVIVAITKTDLPRANPMQVKQQLMIKGLQAEGFGGEVGVVEVSSVTKKGLDDLVERIMLDSHILELKARPDAPGKGVVVESRQSPEQGVVVTVLITDGTLRIKDQIVCGESFARVRAMIDDHGRQLQEAGPSTPVTVFGLDRLPNPGDKLFVVEDAKKAREVVEDRQRRIRELSMAERSAVTLETLSAKLAERNLEEIKIILKADAMGSLEPLRKCLEELSTPEVRVNLVHSALGGINETDVSLAEASSAVIIGFNTVADTSARQAAERGGVEIRYFDVIYELLDQVKAAMEGLLKPQEVESVVGHAEVRALFKSSKFGLIAGCYVTDGICKRSAKARLSRDGKVVYTGKVASLRREKDDAREVRAGFECGLTLQDFQDLKVGDVIEFAQVDLVRRTL
jgi:translation initiation factor IF-2